MSHVSIKMRSFAAVFLVASSVLMGCSSEPSKPAAPEWTHQPSRMVDNGYIVYVGKGEGSRADDAQFKAEGLALEDLANECSLVPKGTRVEDRYVEPTKTGYVSYTKVALSLQDCDEATKATSPESIRKMANTNFTEQLKKYQDLEETGFRSESEAGEEIEPPTEIAAAPAQGATADNVHFYVTRQYIAYQKEIVVLSPPTAYAPGSKEAVLFHQQVVPATETVTALEQKNPSLKSAPIAYHEIPNRPRLERPGSLQKAANQMREKNQRSFSVPRPSQAHSSPGKGPRPARKQKRRRR